jgi:hypothetical protein
LAALSSRVRGTWSLIEVAYVDGLGRVQGGGTDSLALGSVIRVACEGSFASIQLFFLVSEGSLMALVGDLLPVLLEPNIIKSRSFDISWHIFFMLYLYD